MNDAFTQFRTGTFLFTVFVNSLADEPETFRRIYAVKTTHAFQICVPKLFDAFQFGAFLHFFAAHRVCKKFLEEDFIDYFRAMPS